MAVIEIDGSSHSGSGTIIRISVALASLVGRPLHVTGIRSRRPKPGLRAQHLTALRACCRLTGGEVSGDEISSQEIYYRPGGSPVQGDYAFDVGTAGSTTLLAYTLLAPALFGAGGASFVLSGGVFQDFAPGAYHTGLCLVPLLARMGAQVKLELVRPGYVPTGQGIIRVDVTPLSGPLRPLHLVRPGRISVVRGYSLASRLRDQRVAQRMAERCKRALDKRSIHAHFEIVDDNEAIQKGAALFAWTETDSGAIIGADMAGKPGRRAETIADRVAGNLMADYEVPGTVDRHLADQLILFAGLAEGTTEYLVPSATEHVETNLWLMNTILGVRSHLHEGHLAIEGVGLCP